MKTDSPAISRRITLVERLTAAGLTLFAAACHLVLAFHIGAPWRDEINSLNVARMSGQRGLIPLLEFDSFPAGMFLLLKSWLALTPGSDGWLRLLGLLVGWSLLAMIWRVARVIGDGLPLISLAMLGLAPAALWYGHTLRAYGMGMILLLGMITAMWRLSRGFTPRRAIAALLISLAAVHFLYYNAVHLLVVGVAAAGLAALRRDWKTAIAPLAIGGICALTMGIYLQPMRAMSEWNIIIKQPITLPFLFGRLVQSLELGGAWVSWIWPAILAAAMGFAAVAFAKSRRRDKAIWCLWLILGGGASHFLFLLALSYPTLYWYYLTLIALLAAACDVALSLHADRIPARLIRLGLAIGLAAVSAAACWHFAHQRATNFDRIAADLQKAAAPEDLLVITQWEAGISMRRYYRGPTPWMTYPDVGPDHQLHHYNVFLEKMKRPDPITAEIKRIADTLTAGHKVWVIGPLQFLPPDQKPPPVPPAPHPDHGYDHGFYEGYWQLVLGELFKQIAGSVDLVQIGRINDQPVHRWEYPPVFLIQPRR